MTTTIQVTDNIKLVYKAHGGASVGCYTPVVFIKGGKEVRNPANGEMILSKDNHEETIPITEYLDKLSGMWKENIKKHT